jgi:mannose-6-phosphate isomerase-like protein (cupin superfamily)
VVKRSRRGSHLATALVLGLVGYAAAYLVLQKTAAAQREAQGYALGPGEGERLVLRGGDIVIKIDPTRGSRNLALGTQQVPVGVGIPRHRHAHMDEFFHVLDGSGTFILNDVRYAVEKGGTVFIPKGAWHGFENPNGELLLLWGVAPPGLEEFFREISSPPGAPAKKLTPDEVLQIRLRLEAEQQKRLQSPQ